MDFEKAYQKLLTQHGMKADVLSEDSKDCIKKIKKLEDIIKMREKSNQEVPASTIREMKRLDQFICEEILEKAEGGEGGAPRSTEGAPAGQQESGSGAPGGASTAEPVVAPAGATAAATATDADTISKARGAKVELELAALFKAGKTRLTLEELKAEAPTAEAIIFDNYEAGGQNGIRTSHYLIMETEKEVFTITKR